MPKYPFNIAFALTRFASLIVLPLVMLVMAVCPGKLSAAELPVCVACHNKLIKGNNLHPVILSKGCISCHTKPHSAKQKAQKFLFATGVELCYGCHDSREFSQEVKHPPVAAGQCTACHDVHASDNPKLLTAKMPDLCFNCHDKSKFEDKMKHPPVAAGQCTSCHNPHSSSSKKLLVAQMPDLCFTCHNKGRFVGKKAEHPPVAGGLCPSCHFPHASPNEKLLVKAAPDLCFNCHDKDKFGGKKIEHAPVAAGLCLSCHAPHQSDSEKLLAAPTPALCFTCHKTEGFKYENVHPPVAAGMCMSCHRPHSGNNKNLIRAKNKNALCLKCHKEVARRPHAVTGIGRGHPLKTETVVRMGKRKGKLSCLSCHLPHSSEWMRLFRFEADAPLDICKNCHSQ